MAHRSMILTEAGAQVYRNRMLTAGSPVTLGAGDARVFAKHGWATEKAKRAKAAAAPATVEPEDDERPALRAKYQEVFGKRAFPGWDAEMLREKIAAA